MINAVLTIDDISSKNTPAIVDYLKEKGIKAVLFGVGMSMETNYEEALYALKAGMIIGNHSFSHPSFSTISLEQGIAEIEKCERTLEKLYRDAGVERQYRPFRFPYGDKGGEKERDLQKYLKEKKFDKLVDTHISYSWWKENHCDTNIDTFWTYDFSEYCIRPNSEFTMKDVWEKMNDAEPSLGAALFGENAQHILLLHAHDETEKMVPQYYRKILDYVTEKGVSFKEPRFFKYGN